MKLEDAIARLNPGEAADLVKILAIINTPTRTDRHMSVSFPDARIEFSDNEEDALEHIPVDVQGYFNMICSPEDGETPITDPVEQAVWLFDLVYERHAEEMDADVEDYEGDAAGYAERMAEEYNDSILAQQELEDFAQDDCFDYGGDE